jgi:hypothetical protein
METKDLLARVPSVADREEPPRTPEFRRPQKQAPPAAAKRISVIIPAHNEEAYLGRTLSALREQEHAAFEIIVVANGCTDGTAATAQGACDQLIVRAQKGLCAARNSGARRAKGELLVFLDADTMLEPHALRVIEQKFTRHEAAGTLKGRPDSDRLGYRMIYYLKNFIHCSLLHNGSSGVILCWKNNFHTLGGFDERLEVRENSDLIKRLKRFGSYQYIGQAVATTSMRRYEQRGIWGTIWLWIKLWLESLFTDLHHRRYEIVR